MKKICTLITLLALACTMNASHIASIDLTYKHISGNDYLVTLRLARDCGGVQLGPTVPIQVRSNSQNIQLNFNLPEVRNYYMTGLCSANLSNCFNGSIIGYQIREYEDTITLTTQATDWRFFWSSCCRNSAVQNITPASASIMATLDNVNTPLNNSVQYPNPFQLLYEVNQPYTLSISPVDPDNDSLDINFIVPYNNLGPITPNPYTYNAGYSLTNPFPTSAPIILDHSNGNLSFTATQVGVYVIAMKVDEYRNGVLIGSTTKDLQLSFQANSGNSLPAITGASTSNIHTIQVCPSNGTLNIPITSTDPDLSDSTFLWWDTAIANASFAITPGQNETGVFSWTPTLADVSPTPYLVTFKVRDNNCPVLGIRVYTYQIFVNNCSTDSVWAGDANADFTCNNYDVLSIGLASNATGPVRVGATTNWQAEWCANWVDTFLSGMNFKHADCNGDGVVNNTDLASVTANYGSVHFKTNQVGTYKTTGIPDLKCDLSNLNPVAGTTINIPIYLGDATNPMNDLYGIAATVEILNAQTSTPISISNNSSWIGNAVNTYFFEKNLQSNKSAFTIVRNDQQAAVGYGQIATLHYPIHVNAGGSEVVVQFSDIKVIKKTGEEIVDYNVIHDTVTIQAPTAVNEFEQHNAINLYPNPIKSKTTLSIHTDRTQYYQIALYDIVGRLISDNIYTGRLNTGEHTIEIDLSDKSQGEYLIEIRTEIGKKVIPIQKW